MDRDDNALRASVPPADARRHRRREAADAVLKELAAPALPAALRRQARLLRLEAGAMPFGAGEPPRSIFLVVKGDVSVLRDFLGEEVAIQRAGPGDWLAEPDVRASSAGGWAVCEQASVLLAVPVAAFRQALERDDAFARAWERETGIQLTRARRQLERLRPVR